MRDLRSGYARGDLADQRDRIEVIVQELFPAKRDIRSADDLQAAVSSLKPGDVIELKVVDVTRDGYQTRAVSVQIAK